MTLKVLHLSTHVSGGAGRAARSLHEAMLGAGVQSSLLSGSGPAFQAARTADRLLWRLQRSPLVTWRSPARFGAISAHAINRTDADVVNLHWVTDGLLSVEEIGRITKPLVWTMHDMWPFTGTEHYTPEQGLGPGPARWIEGYSRANRPVTESGIDLDRWTWERKRRHWVQRPHLVPVSTWLGELAARSALAASWPSTVIPNVMPTEEFAPGGRDAARAALGLPTREPLLIFTSSAGIGDARKGWRHLAAALPDVERRHPGVQVIVVGPQSPADEIRTDVPIHWLGELHGNARIAQAIRAADVAVVPSLTDNLPMTACEAHACGRPVVAFRVGGLGDIVEHRATGYLAAPYDAVDLAEGICQALDDSQRAGAWGSAARERAVARWSASTVVAQYLAVYAAVTA